MKKLFNHILKKKKANLLIILVIVCIYIIYLIISRNYINSHINDYGYTGIDGNKLTYISVKHTNNKTVILTKTEYEINRNKEGYATISQIALPEIQNGYFAHNFINEIIPENNSISFNRFFANLKGKIQGPSTASLFTDRNIDGNYAAQESVISRFDKIYIDNNFLLLEKNDGLNVYKANTIKRELKILNSQSLNTDEIKFLATMDSYNKEKEKFNYLKSQSRYFYTKFESIINDLSYSLNDGTLTEEELLNHNCSQPNSDKDHFICFKQENHKLLPKYSQSFENIRKQLQESRTKLEDKQKDIEQNYSNDRLYYGIFMDHKLPSYLLEEYDEHFNYFQDKRNEYYDLGQKYPKIRTKNGL